MKKKWGHVIIVLATFAIVGCSATGQVAAPQKPGPEKNNPIADGEYSGPYWPTNGWKTCAPEAVGMDSEKLSAAMAYAVEPAFHTEGIVVVKNGYIIAETYLNRFKQDRKHVSYSMAKSVTSALIGIAIDKGILSGVDEKICQYYEDWNCDDPHDLRSRITLRHALTLTTGLKWQEDWSTWDYETNDMLKMTSSGHYYAYMSRRPGIHEPGRHFYYSTGDPMLLTRVIQESTGMTVFDFAKENLFEPLNIRDVNWVKDQDGYTNTAGELFTTVRSYAKFGYLFLNKGRWDNHRIVSEAWVETSTRTDASVDMWEAYGYLWHVNLPLRLGGRGSPTDAIPADGYMAEGVLGQNIIIVPSRDLLIVRVATQLKTRIDLARLITMVIDAEK